MTRFMAHSSLEHFTSTRSVLRSGTHQADISQMDSILTVPVVSSTDDTRIGSLVPLIVIVIACP